MSKDMSIINSINIDESTNEETIISENIIYGYRNITQWSSTRKYIISLFSWTMGFVHVFHMPELFLRGSIMDLILTYIPLMIIIGIPLTFMELSISQYSGQSTKSWNLCPLFRGIGYSKLIIVLIFQIYYNVLNSYVLLYTFSSFSETVKWSNCNASWANSSCCDLEEYKPMEDRRDYQSSAEQFWFNGVLKLNENFNKLGIYLQGYKIVGVILRSLFEVGLPDFLAKLAFSKMPVYANLSDNN